MFDLAITNGRLVLPDGVVQGTVGVRGGKIAALGDGSLPFKADQVMDAKGHFVLPGAIDIHVHFRDPGLTHKEDFFTGSRAAARGGVTTVADMPNTNPPGTTAKRMAEKRDGVAPKAHVDYMLWAGCINVEEMEGFIREGAIGFKIYQTKFERKKEVAWTGKESPHSPDLFVGDDGVLFDIFEKAAAMQRPVAIHLGNQDLLRRKYFRWDGKPFAAIAHELVGKSDLGTLEATQRCALFAKVTGAHVHLVHIPGEVIPVVARAREEGVRVTAESLCPFMPAEMIGTLGPLGYNRYMSRQEIDALWGAMRSGVVDIIGTDHAPHAREEKMKGHEDILACPSGYPEVQTSYPMMFEEAMRGAITLAQLVRLMASGPAAVVGIQDRKGAIAVGCDADLVVMDPEREWTIRNEDIESKCGWTPFAGRKVRGFPRLTILRGQVIAQEGEVVARPGYGQLLRAPGA